MKKIVFFLYGTTLAMLAWFSYAFVDQNLETYKIFYSGFAFHNRLATTAIYMFFVCLLFLFYILFLKLYTKNLLKLTDIKYVIGMTCLVLLFTYPTMLSYDIFNYIATAKVLFFYHENPYIIMPIAFIGDPLLAFTHAANKLALYGPGWILLTGIPYLIGIGNFFLTIINFKLLTTVFYLLIIFVMWLFTRNASTILLFALNPLVMIELLVSGHNDSVMMFLALFSLFLIKQKKYFYAICFFIASVLIKYATLFLLPVFLFALWKSYHHEVIDWKKIFYFSCLSMLFIFLLSPLREELYPWYAIWFLSFAYLSEKKLLLYISFALSFGLLLRYIPFMYSGTHFGATPFLRILLTSLPVIIAGLLFIFQHKQLHNK